MRSLIALSLLFAACAQSAPTDELAGETSADDAVDGKADGAVDGAYTYFEIWSNSGGTFVARLNRSYTTCGDHQDRAACYVPALDWSESQLGAGLQGKLVDAANQDAISPSVRAIVRGRFAPGRFIVTEAWIEEGDAVSDGVFVRAKTNGVQCIAAPCPTITEKALNTSRSANIAGIDWSLASLTDRETESFTANVSTDAGVIISGDRYTLTENGRHAKGRTATAAYGRLVEPTP